MATTNANESRVKGQYNTDIKSKMNYKPRDNYNKSESGFSKSKTFQDRNKTGYSSYKNKEIQRSNYKDKDDEDDKSSRGHKSEIRTKSFQNKDKDQQIDKLEILKRLEREKKAIQKKKREEEEISRLKKVSVKPKRNSNMDWTKGYVYGLLDEDIDYSEY